MAAVRQRRYGEGVFLTHCRRKGRETKTPAVGLRNRCCVVNPDPFTTQSQSSWGASEGEERLSTATAAAYFMVLLQFTFHPAVFKNHFWGSPLVVTQISISTISN